jgi:hypothetical protein
MSDIDEIYKGYKLVLENDHDWGSPREMSDQRGTMICFHRRYTLGDKHSYSTPQDAVIALTGLDEDDLGQNPNDDLSDGTKYRIVWEPLYLYDHSGITMKTTPFSCPWDSGQVGLIYMTYDKIIEELGLDPIKPELWEPTAEIIAQVEGWLRDEVKEYDHYLRGNVYACYVYEPIGPDEFSENYMEDLGFSPFYGYAEDAMKALKEEIDGQDECIPDEAGENTVPSYTASVDNGVAATEG